MDGRMRRDAVCRRESADGVQRTEPQSCLGVAQATSGHDRRGDANRPYCVRAGQYSSTGFEMSVTESTSARQLNE